MGQIKTRLDSLDKQIMLMEMKGQTNVLSLLVQDQNENEQQKSANG